MLQAVVFDMDGLLVDSEPVWFEARHELLQRHGKIWTEADQKRQMGVSTSTWVSYVTDRLEGAMRPDEVLNSIVGILAASYRRGHVPLLPGATEALTYCAGRYRIGLASGSPRLLIEAALTGAGWHRYFEETVSSDECAHGKPAPDVYLEVMRRMGLNAETTAVVEDSPAGILAGKAANMRVIAVPRGYTSPDDPTIGQADARLESLYQLPETLARM